MTAALIQAFARACWRSYWNSMQFQLARRDMFLYGTGLVRVTRSPFVRYVPCEEIR